MQKTALGRTDIEVSKLCLGTMTWGEQNTEPEAHEQLDYALERGINFIDTAEMYPVPPKAETQTRTEAYIGNWLQNRGNRDKVILATKVAGPSDWLPWIREGKNRLDANNIEQALHDSLKRLQTDYIDLYQLHWPDRPTNYFGDLGYYHEEDAQFVEVTETLLVLEKHIKAGKIRTIGVSNETPWGVMRFVAAAEQLGLSRIVSIQNPYNLLNRVFEIGLAEIAHREDVGLLAYSPLAFGVLTGKYLHGQRPERSRLTLFSRFDRYSSPQAEIATEKYKILADEYGLSLAQMSLAYVNSRRFLTSNIIGATTMEQLKEDIDSIDITLDKKLVRKIETIHKENANPSP
ncbi:MAG: NADP(H)-dependent aldo-keto reductase [Gammaproteobacteria bacterium]|nr:MAG: NADP(H)-dependent aldo-keto reductase [Gammaproteobacteria bacterium]